MTSPADETGAPSSLVDAPTQRIGIGDADLVYRRVGRETAGVLPLVALTHLGANLDRWDPDVVDPLARERSLVLLGYRGVGGSSGAARDSIDAMASDAIAAIRALGFARVDLFGLSMGGMVAQSVIRQAPDLVGRLILASSAPEGGAGLTAMAGTMIRGVIRGAVTRTDPTTLLFFTRTTSGRAAAATYQSRVTQRAMDREAPVGLRVIRAQLRAVDHWGRRPRTTDAPVATAALILHGDSDRMVASVNARALASRFAEPIAQIFPDAGHGVVSQHRGVITASIVDFLHR